MAGEPTGPTRLTRHVGPRLIYPRRDGEGNDRSGDIEHLRRRHAAVMEIRIPGAGITARYLITRIDDQGVWGVPMDADGAV